LLIYIWKNLIIYYFEPDDDRSNNINVRSIVYVLPRVNNTSGLYYYYIPGTTKPKISWEIENVQMNKISFTNRVLIPRDYLLTHFYEISPNPLSEIIRLWDIKYVFLDH
jgi:hypothetical protein